MKGKRYFIESFCLCLVLSALMTGCGLTKKTKTLDEKLKGTIFSELNHKVDKKGKVFYENDKYAVQLTDDIHGKGFYYCILAAWHKDGEEKKIAGSAYDWIGESSIDEECFCYGLSQWSSQDSQVYYEDGITYFCYSGTYAKLRDDLSFRIYAVDNKSGKEETVADIYVAPRTVEIDKGNTIIADGNGKVYQQPDGSMILCDEGRTFYISEVGVCFEDEKRISAEEMTLTYKNGKKMKIKRNEFGESGGCKKPYECHTLWASDYKLQVYELATMEVAGKTYQLQ